MVYDAASAETLHPTSGSSRHSTVDHGGVQDGTAFGHAKMSDYVRGGVWDGLKPPPLPPKK
jgi:hypothetical protein